MKHSIKRIEIKTPCCESWNNMQVTTGGRYCGNCQKNVVDFSGLSNQEIIERLANADNLCGKFDKPQFDSFNLYLSEKNKKLSFFKNWTYATMMLGILPFINTEVKAKPVYEQTEVPFKKNAESKDTVTHIKIRGVVKTSDYYNPLGAATIQVNGTNIKTTTNADGYFEITIPSTVSVITVSYIGYATKIIQIKRNKRSKYRILLNSEANMLGGLGIIRTKKPLLIAGIVSKARALIG